MQFALKISVLCCANDTLVGGSAVLMCRRWHMFGASIFGYWGASMKAAILRSTAIAAVVTLGGAAVAADMPVKAPPPVAPAFVSYFEFSGLGMTRTKAELDTDYLGVRIAGDRKRPQLRCLRLRLDRRRGSPRWRPVVGLRVGFRNRWAMARRIPGYEEHICGPGARRRLVSDTRSRHDLRYRDRGVLQFYRDVGNSQP